MIDWPLACEDQDREELPASFEINPLDLCSKHGFDDGDLFWDVREWLVGHEALLVNSAQLLVAVVIQLVLRHLDPEPVVVELRGCHNPIRALSDEGENLVEQDAPKSWPRIVEVTLDSVLAIARSLAEPADEGEIRDWAERRGLDVDDETGT